MRGCCAFVILPLMSIAGFQDDGQNPEYKAWASFLPGCWVKHRLVEHRPDQPEWSFEEERTCRLVDRSPVRAILEVETVRLVHGVRMGARRNRLEIPARIGIDRCPDLVEDREVREGDEELIVAGMGLKCHWMETVEWSRCGKSSSKVWSCEDIPGGIVNTDSRVEEAEVVRLTKTLLAWSKE